MNASIKACTFRTVLALALLSVAGWLHAAGPVVPEPAKLLKPVLKMPVALAALAAPQNFTAVGGADGVQLSWQVVDGAANYLVLRGTGAAPAEPALASLLPMVHSYLDKGFNAAASYQVVAVGADGRRGASAVVSYQPPAKLVAVMPLTKVPLTAMPSPALRPPAPALPPPPATAPPAAVGPATTGKVIAGMSPVLKGNLAPLPRSAKLDLLTPVKLASFSPEKWIAGGPRKMIILGSGFARKPEIAVKFTSQSGSQNLTAPILAKTDTAIDVQIPAGAKTGRIVLESGVGADLFAVTSSTDFKVPDDILVTSVTPTTTARGAKVTISGKNFSQWDKIEVRFKAQLAGTNPIDSIPAVATNVRDTSFDVVVNQAAVSGDMQVIASLASSNLADNAISFVRTSFPLAVAIPLEITTLNPLKVRRNVSPKAGDSVGPPTPSTTITGQGFFKQNDIAVYFTGGSGVQDQLGQVWTRRDTELMMLIPAGARSGKVKVVLGTGAATETVTSAAALTMMEPVEVTGFAPAAAPRAAKVLISGKNFLNYPSLSVYFEGGSGPNQTAQITSKSDTAIEAVVPPNARGAGKLRVTAGVGTDFELVNSPAAFTVLPTPLSIESVAPLTGTVGTQVTITGFGHNSPVVMFNNNLRATVLSTGEGVLTDKGYTSLTKVTVPQGAVSGPITLLTAEGRVVSADVFTIPTFRTQLTDFQPDTGAVGSVISLQGMFDPVTANNVVTFNGWGQSPVTTLPISGTGQTLQVRVPPNAHTGAISVNSVAGYATLPKIFSLPPSISGFSSASGPAGFEIEILGDNFQSSQAAMTVKFNGVTATTFTPWSGSSIKATIPAGALTGPVTVQTPGGIATSPLNFTVR